ncbi:MAG: DegT/DnrJ/EryC1/StrS aminotransferase family protein [bacterium]|nr:DegT/DnrJ/EryC1/StrS aminotransferase family protein [bacterium]
MKYLKRKDFLMFGKPVIDEVEIQEVVDTLRSGWIGTGPKTQRFEQDFREYIGTKYTIALNSCTAALHLSLLALGIGSGDEVITTPLTFCATVNTIVHVGATPVFVDVEKETFNINSNLIEEKITENTKAIIVVHMAGRSCQMDRIMAIAKKHSLYVIEDAAHAIETKFKEEKVGTIGDIACFSFYANKNLTTAEGGMVTTDNVELAEKIRVLSLHGMDKDAWKRFGDNGYKHYDIITAGYKYNMTDIQASLGIHQFKKIDYFLERRREVWRIYDRELKGLPIVLPNKGVDGVHAMHLYQILTENRDEVLRRLNAENIGAGVHYLAIHLQTYYKNKFGFKVGSSPVAEDIASKTLSLPLSPYMTEEDAYDVVEAMCEVYGV